LKPQKKKKRNPMPREKIEMLRCRVTDIRDGYIVMLPMITNVGIDGSITFTLKDSTLDVSEKDEIVALNIHKLKSGWRAGRIFLKEKGAK